jgi:flagellar export protein FliJ
MKKYNFRLENVRRVQKIREDIAKNELAQANGKVRRADAVVEQRLRAYEAKLTQHGGGQSVEAFRRFRSFNEMSGNSLLAARAARVVAEHEAALKTQAWSEAAKEVKALDRLDERKREEFRVEFDRATDAEIDDIVVARARRGEA